MKIHKKADILRNKFSKARMARINIAQSLSQLFENWAAELEPLTLLMREFKLPYQNAFIEGQSFNGFIVGEKIEYVDEAEIRYIYVFDGCLLRLINLKTDCQDDDGALGIVDFISNHDFNLDHIKAGFDYVRYLDISALREYRARNKELMRFLDDNK